MAKFFKEQCKCLHRTRTDVLQYLRFILTGKDSRQNIGSIGSLAVVFALLGKHGTVAAVYQAHNDGRTSKISGIAVMLCCCIARFQINHLPDASIPCEGNRYVIVCLIADGIQFLQRWKGK